jgi:hypothetical protein
MGGPPGQVDFFISYTSADRAWAEWIAWQLKEASASVVLQAWDMVPGLDFLHEMQKATSTAKRTLAVLSPAYFTSQFSEAEWRVAFADDPSGEQRRLIPIRVIDFQPAGLLATRIYIDLVGKDRQAARTALLDGIHGRPAAMPTDEPGFPGEPPAAVEVFASAQEEPRLPSALPAVWRVPYPRNWAFTGRQALLEELAAGVGGGTATAITQAIAGLGGVGKTSLAVEYAYRQQAAFEVVWWLRAEEPATLISDFTALAGALDLPEQTQTDPALVVAALHRWLADHGRWLLVFDNVTRPEDVVPLLPQGGTGQVLVTSRWGAWGEWAKPLRLQVLARNEAVAFVRKRTSTTDEQAAVALAEALGICRWPWPRRPPTSKKPRLAWRSTCSWYKNGPWSCSVWPSQPVPNDGSPPCGHCRWNGSGKKLLRPKNCCTCVRSWHPTIFPVPCRANTPPCCLRSWDTWRGTCWPTTKRWGCWAATRWPVCPRALWGCTGWFRPSSGLALRTGQAGGHRSPWS